MTFALKRGERINQRQLHRRPGGAAIQAHRRRFLPRLVPRARRHRRHVPGALRGPRLARQPVRRRGGERSRSSIRSPGRRPTSCEFVKIYANSHYVTPRPTLIQAIAGIKQELKWRLDQLNAAGRLLEAQRLEQRTIYDLEMMEATGSCAGIENYSRYLTGRKPGEPPPTLFEYVPDNALVFCDESHVTDPAARRHVSRRLPPQGDARRIRLPPALLHGQPAAALRGMGRDAAADRRGVGDAGRLGDRPGRRRVRRAGDPPDRPDRSAGRHPAGAHAGRRPGRRSARRWRGTATARWSRC